MSYQYITYINAINATCINVNDLKGVVINTFILQLVSTLMLLISTVMLCTVYWGPCIYSCKKNNITPTTNISNSNQPPNNTIEHI
jgi:hypothetical protein